MTDLERELLKRARRAFEPSAKTRNAIRARVASAIATSTFVWTWVPPVSGLGAVLIAAAYLAWPRALPGAEREPPHSADLADVSPPPAAPGTRASEPADPPVAVAEAGEGASAEEPARSSIRRGGRGARSGHAEVPPGTVDTLAGELAILGTARRALARSDPRAALRALDEHRRTFPDGILVEERWALDVRAHCEVGDFDGATRSLAVFSSRYPDSLLMPAVRESCSALEVATPGGGERFP